MTSLTSAGDTPMKDEESFLTGYDPYSETLIFWDIEEFGPEVDDEERFERASIGQELIHCWDRIRDPRPYGKMNLVANQACSMLVRAFGETMKLKWGDAITLMDDVAARIGRDQIDRLMASARSIERHGRREDTIAPDHKSV